MQNHNVASENPCHGQVTLGHLFLGIILCMPVTGAVTEIKHAGGGVFRYLIVAPIALLFGVLIASLDWKLGKAVWLRCQRYSHRAQNAAAAARCGLELLWVVLGAGSGLKLATFATAHLAR
jgi:hypothetical protein